MNETEKLILLQISEKLIDDVLHSEKLNTEIQHDYSFVIENKIVEVKYNSILKAYDFMVVSGKISFLDVTIDTEPCLCIEEKFIMNEVNEMLN